MPQQVHPRKLALRCLGRDITCINVIYLLPIQKGEASIFIQLYPEIYGFKGRWEHQADANISILDQLMSCVLSWYLARQHELFYGCILEVLPVLRFNSLVHIQNQCL